MYKIYIPVFCIAFCTLSFAYIAKTKVHLHINIQGGSVLALQYKKHFAGKWEVLTDTKNMKLEVTPSQYDFSIKTTCGDTIFTNQKVVAQTYEFTTVLPFDKLLVEDGNDTLLSFFPLVYKNGSASYYNDRLFTYAFFDQKERQNH